MLCGLRLLLSRSILPEVFSSNPPLSTLFCFLSTPPLLSFAPSPAGLFDSRMNVHFIGPKLKHTGTEI